MIDLGGLKDKATDLIGDNADKIKDGVEKVGDFVGNKIGHDKVDPIEDKIDSFVDGLANKGDDPKPAV